MEGDHPKEVYDLSSLMTARCNHSLASNKLSDTSLHMHDTHVMARLTQARHVIGNDDDSPPISMAGVGGFEEMTTPLGINSKYDENMMRTSGKSMKTEKCMQARFGRDDSKVGHHK